MPLHNRRKSGLVLVAAVGAEQLAIRPVRCSRRTEDTAQMMEETSQARAIHGRPFRESVCPFVIVAGRPNSFGFFQAAVKPFFRVAAVISMQCQRVMSTIAWQ